MIDFDMAGEELIDHASAWAEALIVQLITTDEIRRQDRKTVPKKGP
jgi:hypothetical protein